MHVHLLSVDLGIEGSLSQEDGVLLWCDTELVVEGVMPDLQKSKPSQKSAKAARRRCSVVM